jgi:hypothetical protein
MVENSTIVWRSGHSGGGFVDDGGAVVDGGGLPAWACASGTEWTTGAAHATAPTVAALMRKRRRFVPLRAGSDGSAPITPPPRSRRNHDARIEDSLEGARIVEVSSRAQAGCRAMLPERPRRSSRR